MNISIILTVNICQTAHLKYVQLIICQLYFNKAVEINTDVWVPPHLTNQYVVSPWKLGFLKAPYMIVNVQLSLRTTILQLSFSPLSLPYFSFLDMSHSSTSTLSQPIPSQSSEDWFLNHHSAKTVFFILKSQTFIQHMM